MTNSSSQVLGDAITSAEQKLETLKAQIKEITDAKEAAKEELLALTAELSQTKENANAYLESLRLEIGALTEQKDSLVIEINAGRSAIKQIEHEADNARAAYAAAQTAKEVSNAELEAQKKTHADTLEAMRAEITNLTFNLEGLKDTTQRALDAAAEADIKREEAVTLLAAAAESAVNAQAETAQIEQGTEIAREKREAIIAELNGQVTALRAEISQLAAKLEAMKKGE